MIRMIRILCYLLLILSLSLASITLPSLSSSSIKKEFEINKVHIIAYNNFNNDGDDNDDNDDNIYYNQQSSSSNDNSMHQQSSSYGNSIVQPYSYQNQQRPNYMNNNNMNNNPNGAPPVMNPLLKQAPTASIVMLFLLLIWRSLASYELAGQFASDSYLRIFALTPSLTILLSNLIGFVVTIFKPINFKNHLKIILAINIVREGIELIYNILKILLSSSTSIVPREVYVGRFFMTVWWVIILQGFSKSRWSTYIDGNENIDEKYKYRYSHNS